MRSHLMSCLILCSLLMLITSTGHCALTIPGANDSDGEFAPTGNIQVDLSQAATAQWDSMSPVAGNGVYDLVKWAVVFKYTNVNIPSGVTVTFKNHPSHAPVVWLVSGNVTIAGYVVLDGKNATNTAVFAEPGPGGFRGAVGGTATSALSGSFGPGGAYLLYGGGSYGTRIGSSSGITYGNPQIVPLIGGSGGGAFCGVWGVGTRYLDGGAGGGAILVACQGSITLSGGITARGGGSADGWNSGHPYYTPYCAAGGSGGAIRLVAASVTGISSATLLATGGVAYTGSAVGGAGRIRIESADDLPYLGSSDPAPSRGIALNPPLLWPNELVPAIRITQVGGVTVPSDPLAKLGTDSDVRLATSGTIAVRLEATNVPTTWTVNVRLVPTSGEPSVIDASLVSGDDSASVWEAVIPSLTGVAALQARAGKP